MSDISPLNGQAIRQATRDWLVRGDFQLFVTLTYDPGAPSRAVLDRDIRAWSARLDRQFLGPRWSKLPNERRTQAVFIVEGGSSNLHTHGVLTAPDGVSETEFRLAAVAHWKAITNGSCQVGENKKYAAANYNVKEIRSKDHQSNLILLPR